MARKDETLPLSTLGLSVPAIDVRYLLTFYHRNGVDTVQLREGSTVVVGRTAPSDVVIDDPSLSRRHARFGLEDGDPWVEDMGSTNGTRIAKEMVGRQDLYAGVEVELGRVRCVVDVRHRQQALLPGVESHDTFLSVADRTVAEAKFFRDSCAVLMMQVRDGTGEERHVSQWASQIPPLLRAVDTVALYGPTHLELLLPRAGAEEARAFAERALVETRSAGDGRVGIAIFPSSAADLEALIERAHRALRQTTPRESVEVAASSPGFEASMGPRLIAASDSMRALGRDLERMANTRLPVLLLGETGTGKELLAQAIVDASPRRDGPFVATNCGAIPSQLVESTLFGHVRGAFTGAERDKPGVFGSADGGTVLLDEVGELPAAAQAALLRVLETGRLTPVGAAEEKQVDVRVIAATHRDLESMVAEGTFREDLLYRINTLTLTIPPLRERRADIAPLVKLFIDLAHEAVFDSPVRQISEAAMRALEGYRFPGNIRELRNLVERACVVADGDTIETADLPEKVRRGVSAPSPATTAVEVEVGDLRAQLRDYEVNLIRQALRDADGVTATAAERLNVPRRTLAHKLKSLGIDRE